MSTTAVVGRGDGVFRIVLVRTGIYRSEHGRRRCAGVRGNCFQNYVRNAKIVINPGRRCGVTCGAARDSLMIP